MLASIASRCAFNYFSNAYTKAFFPLAPDVFITPSFYVYYAGEYVGYLCVWAALGIAIKDMKITFTVLFFAELAAFFDYALRYGADIAWVGFDMNTVRLLAFTLSLPINFFLLCKQSR